MRNLTFRSYPIGDLRIDGTNVFGRNGPEFPEIRINSDLDLRPHVYQHGEESSDETYLYTATELTGDLQVKLGRSSRSETRSVCRLHTDFGPRHVDRQLNMSVTFRGNLTPHHVSELDKHRQNGDLNLRVACTLSIHFQDPPPNASWFGSTSEEVDVTVPRSHWIDNVYPSLGGREVFVVEIPKGEQSIEAAWKKIEDAEDAYHNWNAEGTSIACREAADAMNRAVKDRHGSDSCVYTERWHRAYDGVKDQASLAAHLEQIRSEASCKRPEELTIAQADLECLIIRTKSLLKYAEALLQEGE